ncbi:MAG TPA: hypothetical protein PKA95_09735 [Thermomicrobiales bacterium]|nr:hypothetical protein [Thermomicrobiales bacterium]
MSTEHDQGQDRAVGVLGEDVGPETRQIQTPGGDVETPLERELESERANERRRSGGRSRDAGQALPNNDPENEATNQILRKDIPSGMGGAGGGDLDDLGSSADPRKGGTS